MSRAFTLPMSMALVLAALLGASAPALADEGADVPMVVADGERGEEAAAPVQVEEPTEGVAGMPASVAVNGETPTLDMSGGDQKKNIVLSTHPSKPSPPELNYIDEEPTSVVTWWRLQPNDATLTGEVVVTAWSAATGGVPLRTCRAEVPKYAGCSVEGLTTNQKYWVSAQLVLPGNNTSEHSSRRLVYPRELPEAPIVVSATLEGNYIHVSWTGVADPFDAPISGYTVLLSLPGGGGGTIAVPDAQSRSKTIDISGQSYSWYHEKSVILSVAAQNAIGATWSPNKVNLGVLPRSPERPRLSDPIPTADGFIVSLENEEPAFSYAATATAGTLVRSGSVFTVSGLPVGTQSQVTVVSSRAGHFDGTATVGGVAGFEPAPAVFDTPSPTADGFVVRITNYDQQTSYDLSAHTVQGSGGTVTRTGDVITVSGFPPGTHVWLTVITSRTGWNAGTSHIRALTLRTPSSVPILSEPRPTIDGFTAQIENFGWGRTYRLEQPQHGRAVLAGTRLVVTGLSPNQAATVRVYSITAGESEGSATVTCRALLNPAVPFSLVDVNATADGWTARISDYEVLADTRTVFTASSSEGNVTLEREILTVTGLAPSQSATVVVTLTRTDTAQSTATVSGVALSSHTVTFDASGGAPATTTVTVSYGQKVDMPAIPTRKSHKFTGWFTDADHQTPYGFSGAVTSDLVLYAGWEISEYTVAWNENWPGADAPEIEVRTDTRLGTLPDPSAGGWVIRGWNTTPDGSGFTVSEDTLIASVAVGTDVTLYAMWEKQVLTLEASVAGVGTLTASSGDTVALRATVNTAFGGVADVTADTVFTSSEGRDTQTQGGVRVEAAGMRTFTGVFDGLTTGIDIEVTAGPLHTLTLVPSAATVNRGGKLTFTVAGVDSAGNPVAINSADVMLTSNVSTDVIEGLTIAFPTASPHVITVSIGTVQTSVTVEVIDDAAQHPAELTLPTPSPSAAVAARPADGASLLPSTGGVLPVTMSTAVVLFFVAGIALVLRRRVRKSVR